MLSHFGVATRRALLLLPLLGTVAAAQATLGGLTLRGTGAGFNILDNQTQSSSIVISGFSTAIEATPTNQTVAVRLNNLRHTFAGELTMRVNFASTALASTISWTLLARPGFQVFNTGFGANFLGNYGFGEYDEPNILFTGDVYDFMAWNTNGNLPTGDYFTFDGQEGGSPGALFGGLSPNGTWSLSISDAATGDAGSVGNWDLAFNVSSTVPEPSSVALVAMGIVALAVVGRRRRAA